MKLQIFLVIILSLVAASLYSLQMGYVSFSETAEEAGKGEEEAWNKFNAENLGFSFRYPEGYHLESRELGDGHRGHLSLVLTLDTEENRLVWEGKSPGREGPVAVTFDLYQSPEWNDPLQWVKNDLASNYALGNGAYTKTLTAGVPAIAYSWSGLYEGDSIVFAHRDLIVFASVTYLTRDDDSRNVFSHVLGTIELK